MISLEEVRRDFERLLDEHGRDYVYVTLEDDENRCLYMHDDQPGCAVGHWVFDRTNGAAAQVLQAADAMSSGVTPTPLLRMLVARFGDDWSTEPGVTGWLSAFQEVQDNGETWGMAFRKADHAVGRHFDAEMSECPLCEEER